jgi:hypothetical protein
MRSFARASFADMALQKRRAPRQKKPRGGNAAPRRDTHFAEL